MYVILFYIKFLNTNRCSFFLKNYAFNIDKNYIKFDKVIFLLHMRIFLIMVFFLNGKFNM